MAIITLGPIVGGISGDVGGISFASARGNKVLRKKRRSSPNTSEASRRDQSNLQRAIKSWIDLSAAAKQTWNVYASSTPITNRLGISSHLSGYNMFLKFRLIATATLPPATDDPSYNVTATFTSTITSGIIISYVGVPALQTWFSDIFAMPLYRDTPIQYHGSLQKIGWVSASSGLPDNITVIYENAFGPQQLDQYIAFGIRPRTPAGILGAPRRYTVQTTA